MKKIFLVILSYLLISFNTYVLSAEDKNKNLLKIGVLAPFSGELKELGEEILYSINIALHDLGNPNIKIFPEDSGSDNEKIVEACEKLQINGIKVVIGPVESKLINKLYNCENLIFLSCLI
jgi:ABC-type branched-chain amino acid transport systems, periplasmic component